MIRIRNKNTQFNVLFATSILFFREHEILREEVRSLQDVRSRLQTRISELEEELKKVKQEAEEKAKANK